MKPIARHFALFANRYPQNDPSEKTRVYGNLAYSQTRAKNPVLPEIKMLLR